MKRCLIHPTCVLLDQAGESVILELAVLLVVHGFSALFLLLTWLFCSGLLSKVTAGNDVACLTTNHLAALAKLEPRLVPLVLAFRHWARVKAPSAGRQTGDA